MWVQMLEIANKTIQPTHYICTSIQAFISPALRSLTYMLNL